MSETQTLWGLPVVISEQIPKGKGIIGSFPTVEEIECYGSFEAWLEYNKKRFAMTENLETE